MKKRLLVSAAVIFLSLWAVSAFAAQKLTLMLDWFPNVDHLPIYVARQQGYFSEKGLEIKILSPSDTSDALKLAASGNRKKDNNSSHKNLACNAVSEPYNQKGGYCKNRDCLGCNQKRSNGLFY